MGVPASNALWCRPTWYRNIQLIGGALPCGLVLGSVIIIDFSICRIDRLFPARGQAPIRLCIFVARGCWRRHVARGRRVCWWRRRGASVAVRGWGRLAILLTIGWVLLTLHRLLSIWLRGLHERRLCLGLLHLRIFVVCHVTAIRWCAVRGASGRSGAKRKERREAAAATAKYSNDDRDDTPCAEAGVATLALAAVVVLSSHRTG